CEFSALDQLDRSRPCLVKSESNSRNVSLDNRLVDRREDHHRERPTLKSLLVLHILVTGQEDVEALALNQRKQRTVFDTAPLHGYHGANLMQREKPYQLSRHIFVEQDFQKRA